MTQDRRRNEGLFVKNISWAFCISSLALFVACSGSNRKSGGEGAVGGSPRETSIGSDGSPTATPMIASTLAMDKSGGEESVSDSEPSPSPKPVRNPAKKSRRSKKSKRSRKKPKPRKAQPRPSSGLLTAGSWSDVDHFKVFRKFVLKLAQQTLRAGQSEAMRTIPDRQLLVRLRGKDNQALENVEFRWKYKDGSISRQSYITKTDGSISLNSAWDRLPEAGTAHAMIRASGQMQNHLVPVTIKNGQSDITVKCAKLKGKGVKQLDLCLVIDCTGSMSDELKYLQEEIGTIAQDIKKRYANIKVRFSLVVYRDKGDQYVSKRFEFQDSLVRFEELLEDQEAAGGGDYPEAMDEALTDASLLNWNQEETARVCFLVADAPPHSTRESRVQFALSKLRSQGVVVYPIAASGAKTQAELILRQAAFVTGGKYLFLTDDSGIGNSHAEPHIPEYDVEKLNKLMTRMIVSELAGEPIPARREDIVRSVRSRKKLEPVNEQ